MSMTREEAIVYFESLLKRFEEMYGAETSYWGKAHTETSIEATRLALAALHPVSRETVERIWFREPYTRLETRQGDDGSIVYSAVNTCMACGHETPIGNFCHNCGAAQTVKGVEFTMKRLEALKDGKGD